MNISKIERMKFYRTFCVDFKGWSRYFYKADYSEKTFKEFGTGWNSCKIHINR